jgi:hypothetical protein
VENWEIATGKRESYHELVDYEGCMQTSLSPDGKTFVCLSTTSGGMWLMLRDVDSGKVFYDNKNFYEAYFIGSSYMIVRAGSGVRVGSVV